MRKWLLVACGLLILVGKVDIAKLDCWHRNVDVGFDQVCWPPAFEGTSAPHRIGTFNRNVGELFVN